MTKWIWCYICTSQRDYMNSKVSWCSFCFLFWRRRVLVVGIGVLVVGHQGTGRGASGYMNSPPMSPDLHVHVYVDWLLKTCIAGRTPDADGACMAENLRHSACPHFMYTICMAFFIYFFIFFSLSSRMFPIHSVLHCYTCWRPSRQAHPFKDSPPFRGPH